MKNHFEAMEDMREIAKQKGYQEIEINTFGTQCEGGYSLIGEFLNNVGEQVKILWDAAFQTMTEE